jgi:endonuclease/exonuclease/phosphatase family metal-dependent hydrolase
MASRYVSLLTVGLLLTGIFLFPIDKPEANEKDDSNSSSLIYYHAPSTLAYDELLELGKTGEACATLRPKLDALFNVPFISNEARPAAAQIEIRESEKLGRFIRIASWNIERGLKFDLIKTALVDPESFKQRIKAPPGSDKFKKIIEQLDTLRSVDVIALNEVDVGLKRTEYRDLARELAAALNMNYAFGVEFIEIDPVNLGNEQFNEVSGEEKRARLRRVIEVDKDLYQGLHGTAILSRFPIKRASLIPLRYQAYDWYKEEQKKISLPESARRRLGRMAFLQHTPREMRIGGRTLLIAELDIPALADGSMTIVATHLESRCGPKERRRQMQEALSLIGEIKGPLALVGDLNTSGSNTKPTSIRSELMNRIKNKNFWIKQAVKTISPLGPAFDFMIEAVTFSRTVHDPTARGIYPFESNKEADIFKDLERFRFSDGYAFDFRGDAQRTINKTKGTLANSNHRSGKKGFITTHSMRRTYWAVGKNKLDWILIKAYAREPRGEAEPYKLAPHFARTLEELNFALDQRLSDHNPITVDLPLQEPNL